MYNLSKFPLKLVKFSYAFTLIMWRFWWGLMIKWFLPGAAAEVLMHIPCRCSGMEQDSIILPVGSLEGLLIGQRWGLCMPCWVMMAEAGEKMISPVNLCLQNSSFIVRKRRCWTAWPGRLGTVCAWWLQWELACYQPACLPRDLCSEIYLGSTEMGCRWHCGCWKLLTLNITGIFVLYLGRGGLKGTVLGTVAVCFLRCAASFVNSLSMNTLSFHTTPCLALCSLWGMREIDILCQRALSFSWAVSSKYRVAEALEEEQFLFSTFSSEKHFYIPLCWF